MAAFIRRTARPLAILGCALFLVVSLPATPSGAQTSNMRPGVHVYLFRGLLNVFSLGMDDFANELAKRRIGASVYNHMLWGSAAEDAARNYKNGRARTIVVMGHSMGVSAVISMVERLGQLNVPVAVAVTLDGSPAVVPSGRVHRFVNLYISTGVGGRLTKGPKFRGSLSNVDVSRLANIGHLNIDKQAAIHKMLMGYVNGAIGGSRSASTPRPAGAAQPGAKPAAVPAAKPPAPPASGKNGPAS
ncbi:MAG: hypothetical protein ACRECO_21355 [Xanthobacteraceae bacterium]